LSKKIAIFLFLILSHQVAVLAQKEASNWIFGAFGGVNFSCLSPQLYSSPFDGLEGGACISSTNGELLFITNGNVVWSRDFRIMPNGRDIGGLCTNYFGGSSSSQSSLIVPHPGIPNQYYVFTTDCAEDSFQTGLRYSIIDLSLNGGMGDVIEKDKLLIAPSAEKIAAVFQPNGKDVWVVTHGVFSNTFYAFSITSVGLNITPIKSNAGQIHPGGRGYLKFSPNGQRLVAACFIDGFEDGISPEIFSFNLNTGEVASEFILPGASKSTYGASFSPNGKILYTTCAWTCIPTIEQFNLEAGTPEQIVDQRYTIESPNVYGALQLGIDGRLYYLSYDYSGPSTVNYLSVIYSPNTSGPSCNPLQKYMALPCWIGYSFGLPNFIESYFQSPVQGSSNCELPEKDLIENFSFASTVDCENLTVTFDNKCSIGDVEIALRSFFGCIFDFGDGSKFYATTTEDVEHVYTRPGIYTVTIDLWQSNCVVRTIQDVVEILPVKSQFSYVQDCKSLDVNFVNGTEESDKSIAWSWNFGDNSVDNTSNAKSPTHNYGAPGIYTVTLTATSDCNSSTVELIAHVFWPLTVSLGADTTFCFGKPFTISLNQQGVSYLWNTGHTGPTISITAPGEYSVQLSSANCSVSDTIEVTYRDCLLCNTSINDLNLGNDTTICESDAVSLIVDDNISGDILWNTGSTDRSIEVTSSGKYWVSVTAGNCQASDTLNIDPRDCQLCHTSINDLSLGSDTTICESDALSLVIGDSIRGSVLWSTGSTGRGIDVTGSGKYWVSVTAGNCQGSDTLNIDTRDCTQCNVFIPNTITPNGDGKNDEFSFVADCDYYAFRMDIYNRWGNKLFTTSAPSWNGMIRNETAPSDVYYFAIQYSFTGPQSRVMTHHKKGWIQVLK
jgi:gliding motility-associated-like protein